MVEAKELRIGNWVKIPPNKTFYTKPICKVESISLRGVNAWEDMQMSGEAYFKETQPIPITAEILLKAGFVKDNASEIEGYTKEGRLSLFLEPVLCDDGRTDWYTYIQFNIGLPHQDLVTNPPEYVHQLQNLYYILTGTELEINL